MKHIRKLCTSAAALLALLSFTACGTSAQTPQQTAADSSQTEATQAASETQPNTETQTGTEIQASIETQPNTEAASDVSSLPQITLSSENLHDGVWDDVISNTEKGANRSPQLSWEPVEGASCYAVYMVDTSADCWLHWKSLGITETTLAAGAANEQEYIGPYPPSGTHDYEIRVFALKEAVSETMSQFDSSNPGFDQMTAVLDNSSSGTGNILACGTLTGSFTRE